MRLMRYAPTDWLGVVAMRVEGVASSWVNAVLQEISEGLQVSLSHVGSCSEMQWCSGLSQSQKLKKRASS